jgi:prepilin-type N-terminal cleavage/methylation domain-containing protein/prepilin-type processing-associated H-X9-DG protein
MERKLQMLKKAFTLIELLVVIAIIALLAGILFPVFAQVREKARTATCLSHIQQVSTAIQMYIQDYDEKYPTIVGYDSDKLDGLLNLESSSSVFLYSELLPPYVKSKDLKCPHASQYSKIDKKFLTGYQINEILGSIAILTPQNAPGRIEFFGKHLSNVYRPTLSVLLTETRTGIIATSVPDVQGVGTRAKDLFNAYGSKELPAGTRHNGGSNYVFCDGHAKWYKPDIFLDQVARRSGKDPTFVVESIGFVN